MGLGAAPIVCEEPLRMDYRARLIAADYVLNEELELWMHPTLGRALDAGIAARLTLDQIDDWIAAGR